MKYTSTRDGSVAASFRTAALTGLPPDGGLYVPQTTPIIPISDLKGLDFKSVAKRVFQEYVGDEITTADLDSLVDRSYSTFRHSNVAPLVQPLKEGAKDSTQWENLLILELWHGPTWAFKDVALQFLGNVLELFWTRKVEQDGATSRLLVIGATSGDTGSAAIHGLRGKENIDIIMLYPRGRISKVQERQMLSVTDPNVHVIAVPGTFDDCQRLVKRMLTDQEFRQTQPVTGVNSVNWCRILAQISYYFYAYLQLQNLPLSLSDSQKARPSFVVPTGNFGNILASLFFLPSYHAHVRTSPSDAESPSPMLCLATNRNDILYNFLTSKTGLYKPAETVHQTLAPAMDISLPSNFERALWMWSGQNAKVVKEWMTEAKDGGVECGKEIADLARMTFCSHRAEDDMIRATTKVVYEDTGYLLCPHTAVGVSATRDTALSLRRPIICLATAHPGKFVESMVSVFGDHAFDHPLHRSESSATGETDVTFKDLTTQMNPPELVQVITETNQNPRELSDSTYESFTTLVRDILASR